MERREEGEVVPGEDGYLAFVDGGAVGGFVLEHFRLPLEGGFYRLGRMRIAWRRLGEDE